MKILFIFAVSFLPLVASAINHSSTIPYPFYMEEESGQTEMQSLNRGEESMVKRLEMIRRARRSIEVEYFIYKMDTSGKIFTRELVKAAARGVKVRILIDKLAGDLNPFVAHELAQAGVELKYYNTNVILKLHAVNYRNHRKLVVVDDEEAITGGRNMGDDYFNVDEKYIFEDRDVYVKGPLVMAMKESFDRFYDHKMSHFVRRSKRPEIRIVRGQEEGERQQRNWDKNVKKAQDFLAESEEELTVKAALEKTGSAQLAGRPLFACPVATFVSDAPGANVQKESDKDYHLNFRNVRKTFLDKILPVDKSLTISSPYFIPNKRNEFIYEDLLKRGVEVSLYSNSLKSTDAIYMSANLYLHLRSWLNKGLKVILHDGHWSGIGELAVEAAKEATWGTHAKTHIYETSTYSEVMIGSYNIDNRSDQYNAELGVFCKGNDEFTADVKADIKLLADTGLRVESLKYAIKRDGTKINITGADTFNRLKMHLLTFPSWLFGFLL